MLVGLQTKCAHNRRPNVPRDTLHARPLPPCRPAPAALRHRRIYDGESSGVVVTDFGTKGLLEGCELWGNANGGVRIQAGGAPTLRGCVLRDHAAGKAAGVLLLQCCAFCDATVGADCVFARNTGGDVVHHK